MSLLLKVAPAAADAEADLVGRLRGGDQNAFRALVERHHPAMVRVARGFVGSRPVAEEVAGETWLAVVQGLARFEGRSSVQTWIFRILVNRARSRAVVERRGPAPGTVDGDDAPGAVDPERFVGGDGADAGRWAAPPRPFGDLADGPRSAELAAHVTATIDALPARQRIVVTLRDVEGWSAAEVCDALDLTDGDQRELLHRARSGLRAALEAYLAGAE